MDNVINVRISISELKKILARWDAQVAISISGKKYLDAASALRRL